MNMMNNNLRNDKHNDSIGCTVSECRYHCKNDNYCTLEQIQVAKHETVANTKQCTDCDSFEKQ